MKRLIMIVLVMAIGTGAANKSDERKSADGVALPALSLVNPATFTLNLSGAKGGVFAALSAMGRDPLLMDHRILNSQKSWEALKHRLTRTVDDSVTTDAGDGRTETVHGSKDVSTKIDNEWFSFGFAGEDVTGIDLREGVVSSVVLVYIDQKIGNRIAGSIDNGPGFVDWHVDKKDDGLRINGTVNPGGWYFIHHPDTPSPTIQAIIQHDVLVGMDQDQLLASMGNPFRKTARGKQHTWVWRRDGKITSVDLQDGVATAVHTRPQ
jgi:hypothetical protein